MCVQHYDVTRQESHQHPNVKNGTNSLFTSSHPFLRLEINPSTPKYHSLVFSLIERFVYRVFRARLKLISRFTLLPSSTTSSVRRRLCTKPESLLLVRVKTLNSEPVSYVSSFRPSVSFRPGGCGCGRDWRVGLRSPFPFSYTRASRPRDPNPDLKLGTPHK